jgi:hypothetical protein
MDAGYAIARNSLSIVVVDSSRTPWQAMKVVSAKRIHSSCTGFDELPGVQIIIIMIFPTIW